MKAVICEKYGSADVLELREVQKPVPGDNDVLIKIHAASLNAYDWHLMSADPFLVRTMGGGFFKPKNTTTGADVAGQVEAVGKNVTQFKPGDEVFGDIAGHGGFAEYACAPETQLAHKPANLSFEEAAAVPMAGITALQGLRDAGKLQPGQKVLINGASGGVGTFAVQIAKVLGGEVTAVTSTTKLEQARSLGADHVIDYTREDFSNSGVRYDLIYAANGRSSLSAYKRALAPKGIYVMAGGGTKQIFDAVLFGSWMSEKDGRTLRSQMAHKSQQDLYILKEMIEAGKITPVIDRRYPLAEVREAMRYLVAGHARGKIVLTMV